MGSNDLAADRIKNRGAAAPRRAREAAARWARSAGSGQTWSHEGCGPWAASRSPGAWDKQKHASAPKHTR